MADEKFISGEVYQKMNQASSGAPTKHLPHTKITAAVAIIVLCGLSFGGGMAYQSHKKTTSAQGISPVSGFAGRGQNGMRQGGGSAGQVTSVSDTSITVNDERSGGSKTYSITGSTVVSDNGQTVAASSIKTGDTVLVIASGSDTSSATRILVNPSFGGGFQDGGSSSQPSQQQ